MSCTSTPIFMIITRAQQHYIQTSHTKLQPTGQ